MATPTAVQILKQQFPSVDEATITNVLYTQCNGDTNSAIIILVKVQEFNSATQSNVPSAEATPFKVMPSPHGIEGAQTAAPMIQTVVVQQPQPIIPLQIINHNTSTYIHQKYPGYRFNLEPSTGCRSCSPDNCQCCVDCCPMCYLIPDQYTNGLYPIDLSVKNASFILFIIMSVYGEYSLIVLDSGHHGYYLPIIAMIFILIGACAFYCSSSREPSFINTIISISYIIGGVLYFAGYIVYTWTHEGYDVCDHGTVCDCSYWYSYYYDTDDSNECLCPDGIYGHNECESYWGDDWRYTFREVPNYFFIRGAYILYHCVLMALHYVSPDIKCGLERVRLIKLDAIVFGLFSALVLSCAAPNYLWIFVFSGMAHVWLAIVSFSNCCIAHEWTNKGGCTGFSVTGTLMFIFFLAELCALFGVLLGLTLHADYIISPEIFNGAYFFWAFSIAVFGAFQFWIYLRMIHPTFVHCCCSKIQKDIVVSI